MFSHPPTFSSSPVFHAGTLKSFDCTTRLAECECDHLTDFGALLKYNFAKLEKALTSTHQDPQSFLLGLMVALAPVILFSLVLVKSGSRLAKRCGCRGKNAQDEDEAAELVSGSGVGGVGGAGGSNGPPKRGWASIRNQVQQDIRAPERLHLQEEESMFGVALGVVRLQRNHHSVSTCTLYCKAFVDNHEVLMAFFAKEKSAWDTRVHRGAILITGLYGNFFACTVLFYIYYCRIAGNASDLRLDQLLQMGWFWGDKILISLLAMFLTMPFDSKVIAKTDRQTDRDRQIDRLADSPDHPFPTHTHTHLSHSAPRNTNLT